MTISSSQNALFKKILSLTTSRGIKEHSLALLAGEKITKEAAERQTSEDMFWVLSENHRRPSIDLPKSVTLEKSLFQQVDIYGSHHPLLCLPTPPLQNFDTLNKEQPTIYSGLGDPANLGALLRSAKAFGIFQIVLLEESANPFLPKSLRASSGYGLDFNFFKGPSIRDIPFDNIYGLDMGGDPIQQVQFPKALHLLVGEEGQGVPAHFAGPRLSIPMAEPVESLNASVSVGVLLYEWQRQIKSKENS